MFKKGVIIKTNNLRAGLKVNWDYKLIIYFTLFLSGVIIGVLLIKNAGEDFNRFFCDLLVNHVNAKKNNSFLTDFCFALLCLVLLFFINYLCSLSAVGFPFIWLLLTGFGVWCGAVISEFLISFGLKGLGFCLLVQVPCYAITAATLVCCCCEGTKICNNIFFYLFGNCGFVTSKGLLLKEYTLKYALMCSPLILGALLSSICFKMFSGFFTFV
ncbi:MAG: hypothetical protein IKT55_03455 [Clostridia bacterium]|nr:hypothetical protein [Clostridia bacterium]